MGRLSAYAKNRILKLRFKKNKRIIHIVDILKKDDNIKVSRQAVSTFLKKYLETNSIFDKPRTGRKRKLTQEEIQLIGQVTRLNRDITARAIKEYLNLNVSTYTILRATKLFEWNKINPNSNDSKKAAALERQLNVGTSGSLDSPKTYSKKSKVRKSEKLDISDTTNELGDGSAHLVSFDDSLNELDKTGDSYDKNGSFQSETETVDMKKLNEMKITKELETSQLAAKVDLQLISHRELLSLKNLSCSPMSFATKILFKIFKIDELHGHNVSGKTLNKNLKAKLPLDPVRIGYIKFLVETYYDEKECKEMLSGVTSHKQDLWKSCHTAINKSILISERKAAAALANGTPINTEVQNSEGLSDESYNNILNFQQRNDGEAANGNDDSDDSDIELEPKIIKHKKTKNTVIMTRSRLSTRQVVTRAKSQRAQKAQNEDDDDNIADSDDDDSDNNNNNDDEDYEMSDATTKDDDNETSPNFEIELIQNIENRLVNKNNTVKPLTTKRPAAIAAANALKQPNSNILPVTVKKEDVSTEASAAANIAASMKKRIVVIASSQKQTTSAIH